MYRKIGGVKERKTDRENEKEGGREREGQRQRRIGCV